MVKGLVWIAEISPGSLSSWLTAPGFGFLVATAVDGAQLDCCASLCFHYCISHVEITVPLESAKRG